MVKLRKYFSIVAASITNWVDCGSFTVELLNYRSHNTLSQKMYKVTLQHKEFNRFYLKLTPKIVSVHSWPELIMHNFESLLSALESAARRFNNLRSARDRQFLIHNPATWSRFTRTARDSSISNWLFAGWMQRECPWTAESNFKFAIETHEQEVYCLKVHEFFSFLACSARCPASGLCCRHHRGIYKSHKIKQSNWA